MHSGGDSRSKRRGCPAAIHRYLKTTELLERMPTIWFSESKRLGEIPKGGGVYLIVEKRSDLEEVVYCGKSRNLQRRLVLNLLNGTMKVHSLARKLALALGPMEKAAVSQLLESKFGLRYVEEPNNAERSFLEHFAIAYFRCRYND